MKDLMNSINLLPVINPAATAANDTALVGAIIDRRNYESLTYVIHTGSLPDVDATFTVLLEESDDSGMSGATAVADIDLIGTEALASFTFAHDNSLRKLGYNGGKRYTRLTITPSGNGSVSYLSALAILGHPHATPTVNPPA